MSSSNEATTPKVVSPASVVIEERTLREAAQHQEDKDRKATRNGLQAAVSSKPRNHPSQSISQSKESTTDASLSHDPNLKRKTTSENDPDIISARPSTLKASGRSLRLVVSAAYRNRVTGDVYNFNAARKMMIIPSTSSLHDLIEESNKLLQTDVLEIFVKENDKVVPLSAKTELHGMDEVFPIVSPPPRSKIPCLRMDYFEALNLTYPGHTLLCSNSESRHNQLDFFQKSATKAALLCSSISHTLPVIEEGNQELRGKAKAQPKTGSGWAKVRGKVLDSDRPFFIYSWKQTFKIDISVLFFMITAPLIMGLPIALMKFEPDTDKAVQDHKLYTYAGMCMLGLTTGLFLNAWLGFYFYIHMSILSYICVALFVPGLALLLFKGLTTVAFPFYNTPVCIMLILTSAVILISYPHIPSRLKAKKKTFRKDISNSLVILNFLILVFIVNRLLVTNFGQRDAPSLITLSILYPILVARSTDDCARLAEAFNRKTVSVVEAFFTFVSSVFQMIVFLGIHARVNPLLVFFLINSTDMFCLFMSGPLSAFLKKKNRRLLKHHLHAASKEGDGFSLESFIKWVKDPLKLKPLLIKCYCEISAKTTFIILSLIIRFGPSSDKASYPFIHDVDETLFFEAIYFTLAELMIWIFVQYTVELYLRRNKCQYML